MCRYTDHDYKTHFVCFACRRSVKLARHYSMDVRKCPECSGPLIDVGRDFKAPRRGATNQWRKIEILVQEGLTFGSCGCEGPGPRPRTLSEAKQLRNRRTAQRQA